MKSWSRTLREFALLSLCGIFAVLTLSGFYINNQAPGAAGSMTPIAVGTSTPVAVVKCGPSLGTGQVNWSIQLCCYNAAAANVWYNFGLAPQGGATPCATASPAPNASTPSGSKLSLIQIQPSLYGACQGFGPGPYGGGNSILNGELDAVSDVSGTTCYSIVEP